jgi:predicted RND superfamily exporter protein
MLNYRYSGRPSFYDPNTDIGKYLTDECWLWDGGQALPKVPQNVVIGKPSGQLVTQPGSQTPKLIFDNIKAFEYVFYTRTAEAMKFQISMRPYDPHELTEEDAQNILHLWQDKFMEIVPENNEDGVADNSECLATYPSKREAQIAAVNCRNCDGAHKNDATNDWSPCGESQTSPVAESFGYQHNSYATKTFDDIFKSATDGAVPLIVVGLVLIYAYAFFTTGCSALALGGVTLVIFGLVGGIGCSLWMGVTMNGTHQNVLPFLMIGLGVDDMFLIIRTLFRFTRDSKNSNLSAEEFMARTLIIAGPSVSLTTLANFSAFIVGTLTPIPAVQEFCKACAITTLVMYVPFEGGSLLTLKRRDPKNFLSYLYLSAHTHTHTHTLLSLTQSLQLTYIQL